MSCLLLLYMCICVFARGECLAIWCAIPLLGGLLFVEFNNHVEL